MLEEKPLITLKDLEFPENSHLFRTYNDLIKDMFKDNKSKEYEIKKKYLSDDRTVLDRYLANDFEILNHTLKESRQLCRNDDEVKILTGTVDFQVDMLRNCKSHRDFLLKSIELKAATNFELRREYNSELFSDVLDYFLEKIEEEQAQAYWL